jgi:hypothetical protein
MTRAQGPIDLQAGFAAVSGGDGSQGNLLPGRYFTTFNATPSMPAGPQGAAAQGAASGAATARRHRR